MVHLEEGAENGHQGPPWPIRAHQSTAFFGPWVEEARRNGQGRIYEGMLKGGGPAPSLLVNYHRQCALAKSESFPRC